MTTPMRQRIEKKKKRKLSFKSTPIVYTITDDNEVLKSTKEDIGFSIEDRDIVSKFLNIKNPCDAPVLSVEQFEEEISRRQQSLGSSADKDNVVDEVHKKESRTTERVFHFPEKKKSGDSMLYNQDKLDCQNEKLSRLTLEQEQSIKQTYLIQDIQISRDMGESQNSKCDNELSIEELDLSQQDNTPLPVNELKKPSKLTERHDINADTTESHKKTNDNWGNIELVCCVLTMLVIFQIFNTCFII